MTQFGQHFIIKLKLNLQKVRPFCL